MLRELLSLFRPDDASQRISGSFLKMLRKSHEMTTLAGQHYFDSRATAEELSELHNRDTKLNKLQRKLRKKVIAHLTLTRAVTDAQHGLLFMSLVKDVERIGDYAKNLSEIYEMGGGSLPDDANAAELREIRTVVEGLFTPTIAAFEHSDSAAAAGLIRQGREVNQRCDALLGQIVLGPYDAATTTSLVLGSRFYKRIQSHLLNVLSAVIMPLHKLDYFEEKSLTDLEED